MSTAVHEQIRQLAAAFDECVDDLTIDEVRGRDTPTIAFGPGESVAQTPDGGLVAHSADGTRVTVTPLFWSTQNVWYLDIALADTPAREGLMGTVLPGEVALAQQLGVSVGTARRAQGRPCGAWVDPPRARR